LGHFRCLDETSWGNDYVPYLLNFPHILSPYCYRCDYQKTYPEYQLSCADELERVVRQEGSEYISAFIVEPVLGTSAAGVAPPADYYPRIREICNEYNILMIADEVVTGFGRTGRNFGIEHWNVVPDIMSAGKGLIAVIHLLRLRKSTILSIKNQHPLYMDTLMVETRFRVQLR